MTGSGRPSRTSGRSYRRLARQNPFASSSQLLIHWDVRVSSRTVSCRLRNAGLFSRWPADTRALLTPQHRQIRLQWAMCRCHFQDPQWQRIVFTDESRFHLRPVNGRIRICRMPGEILRQDLVEETTVFGGSSVLVCCHRHRCQAIRRSIETSGIRRID